MGRTNSLDQFLVENLWPILGDKLVEDVKPPVSEKDMSEDPHEDLEKLDPLYVQSDTSCNKGQRPLPCYLI